MNIPPVTSIETALKIYYSYSELGNKEIAALFGRRSSATVSRLKRLVKDEMNKKGIVSYGANKVNTSVAFNIWGIDVKDLEKRMKKIQELNLQKRIAPYHAVFGGFTLYVMSKNAILNVQG